MHFLSGFIILVLGFYGVPACGGEIPIESPPLPENVQPVKESNSTDEGYIDRSHGFLDRKINGVVTWFDGFFGEPDGLGTPMAENRLQWTNELRAQRGESLRYRSSINAHLRLPKLEKKIRLVIIEENREEAVAPIPSDPGTPVANTPTKTNTLRAVNTELRYYARDTKAGYAFLAAGTRFVWLPETFVRARVLWRRPLGDNTFISPSATPFWQDHIGFGLTPQLDFGHTFTGDHVFLWANSATVFDQRPGFLWGTEVSLSRVLSPVSAISFAVGANGSTNPSGIEDKYKMAANNYRVTFKYRRSIYRPWLFVELNPETSWRWDEATGREIIPAFTARLEINSLGPRALLPVPKIVQEKLPIPDYDPY